MGPYLERLNWPGLPVDTGIVALSYATVNKDPNIFVLVFVYSLWSRMQDGLVGHQLDILSRHVLSHKIQLS